MFLVKPLRRDAPFLDVEVDLDVLQRGPATQVTEVFPAGGKMGPVAAHRTDRGIDLQGIKRRNLGPPFFHAFLRGKRFKLRIGHKQGCL